MNLKDHMQLRDQTTNLVVRKSALWSLLSLLFYKLILDVSYYFVISPVWTYAKFELHFNVIKLVESYLLLLAIFIFMPKSSKKLSSITVELLILFSYIPMLTIFAFKDEVRIYMYAVTGFWITVFLLLHMPTIFLPSLKQAKIICYSVFISLSIIALVMIYKYLGFSFNFDLTKVYHIRSRYVSTGVPLTGYLFTWLGYIVNPVFFAIFVQRKKWICTAIVIFIQLLLFSVTGNKSFLFALPFVVVLMWIVTRKNLLACTAIGLTAIILLGMLSYSLMHDVWISSLFTRRALLVPAQLSFFYYDFFSNNDYTFLSQHRIFRTFLDYPYGRTPPHLIGEVYYNSPETGANNGIVADAYMNFGFIGFVLWSILLAIILRIIDSCSRGKNIKIVIGAIAMPVITLTNSALLTCLLTHGLLLALILLYLLPKEKTTTI